MNEETLGQFAKTSLKWLWESRFGKGATIAGGAIGASSVIKNYRQDGIVGGSIDTLGSAAKVAGAGVFGIAALGARSKSEEAGKTILSPIERFGSFMKDKKDFIKPNTQGQETLITKIGNKAASFLEKNGGKVEGYGKNLAETLEKSKFFEKSGKFGVMAAGLGLLFSGNLFSREG